ncbi:HAD family hydrolase [Wukongibacter sp. M2B1]|uniref:HAD family hydrolase n=1 Tax=Wukongibacter sp. M2B1 TaxID=3088895 RepID=UPI003D79AB6E
MGGSQKIICFDYYGTLVKLDSPFEQIKKLMKEYVENNLAEIDFDKFYAKFSRNRAVLASGQNFLRGIDLLVESLVKTCTFYKVPCFKKSFIPFVEKLFTMPEAYPDACEAIDSLRKNFIVGVLSNADNYIIERSIKTQGFELDFVITSEDARANKPSSEIFLYAMEILGRRPDELYMIGDSQIDDILGAGRLGINTIWINRDGELLKEGISPPSFELDALDKIPSIFSSRHSATL